MLRKFSLLTSLIDACMLTFVALLFPLANVYGQDVDYSSELPRIAPTEAGATSASFQVAAGFEMHLVAAEPLVSSPVAIEWDACGAMYVCEMRGYSENRDEGISRIARLTDTNNDGVYDARTEYAENLFWPTAIFPFDGGLFVGDAPDLLYFKDTDDDGKADVRRRVLTGFGTSNVQGLMNSMRWGLDNRIHIACSSVGGEIRRGDAGENEASVNVRGRDLAFNPRTYEFEPTSGAAQHGMCFDDWGRKFVSSNSDHLQQVMYEDRYIARNPFVVPPPSRISIAADGPQAEVFRTSPVEPWRIVRTRLRVSGLAKGPIEGGGRAAGYFTGATGATIYRGDAWPPSMRGLAVVGDVGSNLVHRKRLTQQGLEFVAKRMDQASEFVTSTDIWFRPAQFAAAPDGALHVIDVYREVIEHPLSLPAEIKQHLDLTAGRDRGRIYRLAPQGFQHRPTPNLAIATTNELVQLLQHPNAWHRETAARLLFERQDDGAVDALQKVAGQDSALGRMHAMYALNGIGALDEATLLAGLADAEPQVRAHAVKLAENVTLTPAISERLSRLVNDSNLEVRYQLAFTVGSLPLLNRSEILVQLIHRDVEDRWMRAAVLSSSREDAAEMASVLQHVASFNSPGAEEFKSQLAKQLAAQTRQPTPRKNSQAMAVTSRPSAAMVTKHSAARQAIVAKYREALSLEGNVRRGREHFTKHCSVCHRADGIGHEIGPNLAAIKTRGAETIIAAVLDPNAEVNPLFLNYVVSTLDGRVVSGVIADEGATSLTLRRQENVTETLLRIDIDEIKNTGLSIMPEGMEQNLDKQAMSDLIAFLMQVR